MSDQLSVEMIVEAIAKGFDQIEGELKGAGDAATKAGDAAKKSGETGWTTLNNALGVVQKGLRYLNEAYDATIGYTIAYADQVRSLSRTIGASAEESSKLIQAADDVGISAETIQGALEIAIRKGINPTIAGIGALADQYIAIQDPIARTKFLMDKFGRSGSDLGALMEKGAAGIKAAGDEAENFGLVLSQKDLKAARDLEIQTDNLDDAMKGLGATLGKELIPVAVKGAENLNLMVKQLLGSTTATEDYTLALSQAETPLNKLSGTYPQYLARLKEAAEEEQRLNAIIEKSNTLNYQHSSGLSEVEIKQMALANATSATTEQLKAANDATAAYSKALSEYQGYVTNTALAQGKLAETLLNAKPADLAKQSIAALQEQMKNGENPGVNYAIMIESIQLKYGLASKSSIAMAEGLAILNKGLADGTIAPDQYAVSLGKIPAAARDGIISAKELGVTVVGDFKSKIDRMDAEGNAAIVKTTIAPLQKVRDAGAAAVAQWSLVNATIQKIPLELTTNYHFNTIYSQTGTPPVVPPDSGKDGGQGVQGYSAGSSGAVGGATNKTTNLNLYVNQPMNNVISEFGMLRALAGDF